MRAPHRIHPVILGHAREMRHPQTAAEAMLWQHLRNGATGYKFRRQHPIQRFIVDFYCARVRLCIEIDGNSHLGAQRQEYDRVRTEYLEELGYKVIRFSNDDVRHGIHAVTEEIMRVVGSRLGEAK